MRNHEVSIKLKNLGGVEGLVKHKLLFSFYIVLFRCLNNCSFFQWWMCFVKRKFMDKSLSAPGQ